MTSDRYFTTEVLSKVSLTLSFVYKQILSFIIEKEIKT